MDVVGRKTTILSMKPLFLSLVGYVLALSRSDALAQQTSAPPATLKVSIVIPEMADFQGQHAVPRTLINQQPDGHFHVVLENVSDHAITLMGEGNPLSFELAEADGAVLKLEQSELSGSRRGLGFRLAPGELRVLEVYYTTQEQYFAVTRHAPSPGRMWAPEFPFTPHKDKTVTLRAVYEQRPSGPSTQEAFWTGRVVSVPCKVVLVYP